TIDRAILANDDGPPAPVGGPFLLCSHCGSSKQEQNRKIYLKKEQIRYMMPAEFNISRNSRPAECPAKIHMDRVGWLCQKENGHDRSRGGPENEK
ncbi:MAG: hypothetical protein VYE49_08985, partial [Pseudomonadota bacterium]|nr:hypothetical protein [Pseudomonadota bacterium]